MIYFIWFNKVIVLPCDNEQVYGFVEQVNDDESISYYINSSNGKYTFGLDAGHSDGQLWLYYKTDGNLNQQFHWFQKDLSHAGSLGCDINYPFPFSEKETYERELSCDRVAKIQPPFIIPDNILRNSLVFPGKVSENISTVKKDYDFNLKFKNNDYMRIIFKTKNWLNTGLYAAPNEVINIVVSNALDDDLKEVSVLLGVHTDVITDDQIYGTEFLRNPNVTIKLPLKVGSNLVRSPYGGPIVLISDESIDKTIKISIEGAVEMPYLKVGSTTESDWLSLRNKDIPYGSLESNLAVIYVPSEELSKLSYKEAVSIAEYYTTFGKLHNELSGLSDDDISIHQPQEGKYWYVSDKQISGGWGHSGYPSMYYNEWELVNPDNTINSYNGSWGQFHELGHNYQMYAWSHAYGSEVTTNLFSLYAQEKLFNISRLVEDNRYQQAINILNNPLIKDKWNNDGTSDPFIQLVFLDQIRLAFPDLNWDIWKQLMRKYRGLSDDEYNSINTDELKYNKFMILLCEITNTNLTHHFEKWSIPVTSDGKSKCGSYESLKEDIWLINQSI